MLRYRQRSWVSGCQRSGPDAAIVDDRPGILFRKEGGNLYGLEQAATRAVQVNPQEIGIGFGIVGSGLSDCSATSEIFSKSPGLIARVNWAVQMGLSVRSSVVAMAAVDRKSWARERKTHFQVKNPVLSRNGDAGGQTVSDKVAGCGWHCG